MSIILQDDTQENELHFGVRYAADLTFISYIVSEKVADINSTTSGGKTALHMAILGQRDADVVEYLIKQGIDINAKDQSGNTAIMSIDRWISKLDAWQCILNQKNVNVLIQNEQQQTLYDIIQSFDTNNKTHKTNQIEFLAGIKQRFEGTGLGNCKQNHGLIPTTIGELEKVNNRCNICGRKINIKFEKKNDKDEVVFIDKDAYGCVECNYRECDICCPLEPSLAVE